MKLRLERLEDRCPASTFLGSSWPQSGGKGAPLYLSYTIGNLADGGLSGVVTPPQVVLAVREALSLWARASPLFFVEVPDGSGQITFNRAALQAAAGVGYPPPDGRVLVDSYHPWTLDRDTHSNLLQVLTHEIGHTLGLGHEDSVPAIMMSTAQVGTYGGLGTGFLYPDDVAGIQTLYGAGVGSVTLAHPIAIPQGVSGNVNVASNQGHVQLFNTQPFPGYAGRIMLAYVGDNLVVVASNGHAKTYAPTGVLLVSVLGAPPSTGAGAFPGYAGEVNTTTYDGKTVCLAVQGGHVKVFEFSGALSASFLSYDNYAGTVSLGGMQHGIVTIADAANHVKAFDGVNYSLTQSYIRS